MTSPATDNLEQELKTLPPQVAAALAVRSALRVLPALATRKEGETRFFVFLGPDPSRALYAVLRTYATAVFVSRLKYDSKNASIVESAESRADSAWKTVESTGANPPLSDLGYEGSRTHFALAALLFALNAACNGLRTVAWTTLGNRSAGYIGSTSLERAAETSAKLLKNVAYAAQHAGTAVGSVHTRAAIENDLAFTREPPGTVPTRWFSWFSRSAIDATEAVLARPIWPTGMPQEIEEAWQTFRADAVRLDAGFDVWLEWYTVKLAGNTAQHPLER